jgi:hypothetical protein
METRIASPETGPSRPARAHAYTAPWRVLLAGLLGVAGASLPVLLVLVAFATDPPVTPPVLARLVLLFALLPWMAARLLRRTFAAEVEVRPPELVVRRHGVQIEIPVTAIERVAPWWLPLPGPGLWLHLRSGRRLSHGIEIADPAVLLAALARAGAPTAAAVGHPIVAYARARQATAPWRWYHLAAKFGGFGFLATLPLFNVHQHIAYGGLLGEYYLMGLAAYLGTFATYWGTTTAYLAMYAGVWRGLAEATALAAAWLAPARAQGVRRLAEAGCRLAYYGGVPLLVLVRFLPW